MEALRLCQLVKPVPGTHGRYYIHRDGRLWSAPRRKKRAGFLVGFKNADGYHQFCLRVDGRSVYPRRAQLIAEAFVGPRPTPDHEVDHKNAVRDDDVPSNLEWVTHAENVKRAAARGNMSNTGTRNPRSFLTEAQIIEVRRRARDSPNLAELANEMNLRPGHVYDIVSRRIWKHLPECV